MNQVELHPFLTQRELREYCQKHGLVVLPKSNRPQRIRENAALFEFELSQAEMERLDALDEGFRTSWDPTDVP